MTESSSTSVYKYAPLSAEDLNDPSNATLSGNESSQVFHIRLLTIKPGRFDPKIRIELETIELNPENTIKYEVLSYVWGSMEQPDRVYLGSNSEYHLEITQNLAITLRELRMPTSPRKLWIDAICIDQSNLQERGQQVGIMGDIYRLSDRCLMWLGPESDDSGYALDLLRDIGSRVSFHPTTGDFQALNESEATYAKNAVENYEERELSALLALFKRPWFDRLWIRQEVHLTKSKAKIQIGLSQITWHMLCRAAVWIWRYHSYWKSTDSKLLLERLTVLTPLFYGLNAKLGNLRQGFGHCLCGDPRDRVYAVMNILPKDQRALIGTPDYTLSVSEVWKKTTISYLNDVLLYNSENVDILLECLGKEPFDTPSWIPKWGVDSESAVCRTLKLPGASGWPFKAKIEFLHGDVLRILGVCVQTVHDIYPTPRFQNWISTVKRFLSSMDLKQDYPNGGTLLEACAFTFSGGDIEEFDKLKRTGLPSLSTVLEAVDLIATGDEEAIDRWNNTDAGKTVDSVFQMAIQGRCLVKTEDGHFGLAPYYAKCGDLVVVLAGCLNPVVLRRADQETSNYHLIGQGFLEGFMSCEAFLGQLPAKHRYVDRLSPFSSLGSSWLLNSETGEFVVPDPRLEPWPLDLETYRKAFKIKVPYAFDVDVETFRSMGINVEYFDLV